MYSALQLGWNYCRYYIGAANGKGHGIHSPFVFQLVKKVLNNQQVYPDYAAIESLRTSLLQNKQVLQVEDYGAGSVKGLQRQRTVQQIAASSLKSPKYAQLLYRLGRYFQPATILELGTSLGITTAYLAKAAPEARLITMEGSGSVAAIANEQFTKLNLQQVESRLGNFDETLPALLREHPEPFDFVFVDGNHTKEATLRYFKLLLTHMQPQTVLIFDDIHWSKGMEEAWNEIKQHEKVRLTIDLFFVGLVFFRSEQLAQEHFIIRF
jgi:predicted O-methyltransferase YrrM